MKQEETNIRYKYASPHIPNAVFYIPFAYYYAVRLGTIPKLMSWMLIYMMPTAFYSAVNYTGSPLLMAINYALILFAVFSLYEFGYIINDNIAIHHEQNPTIRLYNNNFVHFERWKNIIAAVRLLYSLVALSLLSIVNGGIKEVWLVIVAIIAMCGLFSLYNIWRSIYNVWLYPLLVCSRYIPFMLIGNIDWLSISLLIISFPLLNALERFSMPRHRFPIMRTIIPTEQSKTAFRVLYYLVILAVLFPVFYLYKYPYRLLIPILILFLYRLILVFIIKQYKPKNYLNG